MKAFAIAVATVALLLAGAAEARCTGTETYKRCTDDSGNSYTVKQYGNRTQVDGYNYQTGNSWSQSTQRTGNTSRTTGYDADGNQWTQNTRRSGNTTYQSGYDSDGRSYNGTVRRNGSSTTYSGNDSDGNYYRKTCNQFGCY